MDCKVNARRPRHVLLGRAAPADPVPGRPEHLVLGATVLLDGDAIASRLGQPSAHVDVVLDYLWGEPTAAAMAAVVAGRADPGRLLTWIEIGSVAGPTAAIPSAALRAARLQLVGSGQGSVSSREFLAELSSLAGQITAGTLGIEARPMPLAHVEQAWTDGAHPRQRIVITPSP